MWVNGGEITTTYASGALISAWNPTSFIGTNPFCFGGKNRNNAAAIGSTTNFSDYFYAAFTDKLSDSDAYNVSNFFLK